jgi:hypothetical protein
MTKDEALKMALRWITDVSTNNEDEVIKAIEEALATNKESSLVQPAQEPVAWMMERRDDELMGAYLQFELPTRKQKISHHPTPLYTYPHEWQGLTAKEIASIPLDEHTVQTVEKILKRKNT